MCACVSSLTQFVDAVAARNTGNSYIQDMEARAKGGGAGGKFVDGVARKNKGPSEIHRMMHPAFVDKGDEKTYKAKIAARTKAGIRPAGPAGAAVGEAVTEQLKKDFANIDTSGDGYLTFDELMVFLVANGKQISKGEAMDILLEIDDNEDVRVTACLSLHLRPVPAQP